MPEELTPKQFDTLAKIESLLEASIFTKLAACAFYAEFALRHLYGISLWNFNSFASLRDFVLGQKPVCLALIAAGAAVVPRAGLLVWASLQGMLDRPASFFNKEQREENFRRAVASEKMRLERGIELARRKRDDYFLQECEEIKEKRRKITVTKINLASIFALALMNLILYHYPQTDSGLILRSLAVQWVFLIFTAIYAGIPVSDNYSWVDTPEDYSEEEIRPSRFRRLKVLPLREGERKDERLLSAFEHGCDVEPRTQGSEFEHELRLSETRRRRA